MSLFLNSPSSPPSSSSSFAQTSNLSPSNYNSSCPECSAHVKEMIRIHELWQSSKREVREARRAHDSLITEYRREVDRVESQHQTVIEGFKEEIENLRSELKSKSELIKEIRSENTSLNGSIDSLNEKISLQHAKLADQMAANAKLQVKARENEEKINLAQNEANQRNSAADRKFEIELRTAREKIEDFDRELSRERRRAAEFEEKIRSLEVENNRIRNEKISEAANLRAQSSQAEIQRAKASDAALKTELDQQQTLIDQQNEEIRRLKNQLEDLKSFESLVEQSAIGEFRRSRAAIEQRLMDLQSECASVASMIVPAMLKQAEPQMPNWIPNEVQQLVKQFRVNLGDSSRTPAHHLTGFLISLNSIWRDRLNDRVRQLRSKHETEIAEMRRKLEQRLPYEQIVQKARILRLQKNLDDTRASGLNSRGEGNKNLLDLSLSTVENLSRQIMEYENENTELKRQVASLIEEKEILIENRPNHIISELLVKLDDRINSQIKSLEEKVATNANSYMERSKRLAKSAVANGKTALAEFPKQIAIECELFIDALDDNLRECKSSIRENLRNEKEKSKGK